MPPNNGLTMQLRKVLPIESNTTKLTEGNPGDGKMLAQTEVTMTLEQYGDYARYTDKLDMAHLDATVLESTQLFADAGSRSIDAVVRDEIVDTTTNVLYAGKKTTRSALTASDKMTSDLLLDAVKILKKNHAQRIGSEYVAIIGPDVWRHFWDDERFTKVTEYQDKEKVYNGEVGKIGGVRLVESSEAKIYEKAGNSGTDVAAVLVVGRNAYGYTSWKGANPRVIVKPFGSAGTSDPLDQISTVGWKMDGFGVKLLQPEWAVRIECGI
jgi:N4-gp56 family major capsid protein